MALTFFKFLKKSKKSSKKIKIVIIKQRSIAQAFKEIDKIKENIEQI